MRHLGDITKIQGDEAPVVDVIIGGSPCQDLSVAGKRAGLAGERSGLFMEQIRIIKEMRKRDELADRTAQYVRPRYMVWENVPGAFSSNGGKDFAAVLEETIRVIEPEAPPVPVPEKGWPTSGCLMGEQWSVAWRVLDAQFWGVPQRRRRIALVADFGGHSAPEILFVLKSLSGDSEPGRAKRESAAGDAGGGIKAAGFSYKQGSRAGSIGFEMERAPSLLAGKLDAAVYDARGNGDGNISCTITGDHESRVTGYSSVVVEVEPVYCLQGNGIDRADTACCNGKGWKEDTSYTLNTIDRPAVAFKTYQRVTGPLMANSHPGSYTGQDAFSDMLVAGPESPIRYIVRRLTPLECERLQGFPDGWTDIGEWTDSKGKKHKEADSPRYKALGNSIAIPPWKWILKRLCACYERDATMASLFDGIGGFPYIWEQLNGKGSCVWASEIEEFPMAVTRVRFGGDDV